MFGWIHRRFFERLLGWFVAELEAAPKARVYSFEAAAKARTTGRPGRRFDVG